MGDIVLNSFIDRLLSENIDEEKFRQYIDIFSRFLGYVNPDYKYNGTYLSQYVSDFENICRMLKKKNEKYYEVFMKLIGIGQEFELIIDRVFCAKFYSVSKIEREYVGIDKSKILSNSVEIRFKVEVEKNEYIFCKEYDNFEDRLSERVCKDVKQFIKIKKDRREDNATT